MERMGVDEAKAKTGLSRRHRFVAAGAFGLFALMFGAAFAAVPIYKLICEITGIEGTTQRADTNTSKVLDRRITVHFDANTGAGMPWTFEPEKASIEMRIGETSMAFYTARNPSTRTVSGTATFNVTPEIAGRFFKKIDCFCFEQQTLKAGESAEMPVQFFIDPAIVDEAGARGITDITLSYTFFAVPDEEAPVAAAPAAAKDKGT